MIQNEEKNQSIKTDLELTQLLEFGTNTVIKTVVNAIF